MACSVLNINSSYIVKLITNVIKAGITELLICSFATKANKLYKMCTNKNYIYCIRIGAIAALNYILISGLWATLSGIFSAPGTFLAIKNGFKASIAFGSS